MLLTLLLFLGSAIVIYLACELFVNGVEWLGHRLSLTQTATAPIRAAFGTALPESVVTFVAVASGPDTAAKDLGVGAALGGPLALSTLVYRVVGLTLLGSKSLHVRKKEVVDADCVRLSHDQGWSLVSSCSSSSSACSHFLASIGWEVSSSPLMRCMSGRASHGRRSSRGSCA